MQNNKLYISESIDMSHFWESTVPIIALFLGIIMKGNNIMNLTQEQLNIIKEGIVKLNCHDCEYLHRCEGKRYSTCSEISEWLKERIEEC